MIIEIKDDLDLHKIINSGQCFRASASTDNYCRFVFRENILLIRKIDEFEYEINCDETVWNDIWKKYFDLDTSYSDIRKTIDANDKYLHRAAAIGEGIRILNQDPWEMLISFIISQRRSIPSIRGSVEKICRLYGHEIDSKNGIYTFPTYTEMKDATIDEIASCSVGYRAPYILDAIRRVNYGELDLNYLFTLDDESLFSELKSVKGVGDKVANCIMLFAYHRMGRAPIDTWISKVIECEYGGKNPFPRYGENAGLMQQYMFYAAVNAHK